MTRRSCEVLYDNGSRFENTNHEREKRKANQQAEDLRATTMYTRLGMIFTNLRVKKIVTKKIIRKKVQQTKLHIFTKRTQCPVQ